MDNLNLVVKYKLAGDAQFCVRAASRMKMDGRGGLIFSDAQGAEESIDLGQLQSLWIHSRAAAKRSDLGLSLSLDGARRG